MTTSNSFSLQIRDDAIGIITMDIAGESMNVLKAAFADEISQLLSEIKANSQLKGLVFISGKPDSFIAGADISMIDSCKKADEAAAIGRMGQQMFEQLEQLPIPLVAAIHGPCLGGGLELAMACHARVASNDSKTVLGLPEVQLGLLPGSGGTQRLPRLVGLQKALDMILTGKQLRAAQAKKAGLVDEVVANSILLEAAVKRALKGKPQREQPKLNLVGKVLERTPFGRNIVFSQARKQTLKKTQGNYPAPLKILDVIKTGVDNGMQAGLAAEAKAFGDERGLELAKQQTEETMRRYAVATPSADNSVSFNEAYGTMVSFVGDKTAQARNSQAAAEALYSQTLQLKESLSGVSLDEEAANLVRFQQSYAASAKIIATSQTVFDTLLQAVR